MGALWGFALLTCALALDRDLITEIFTDVTPATFSNFVHPEIQSLPELVNPNLALGIVSKPARIAQRNAMRHWLNAYRNQGVVYNFFVGCASKNKNECLSEELRRESEQYSDLFVVDSEESYLRVIVKVLAIFKWGATTTAPFVAKMDDGESIMDIILH